MRKIITASSRSSLLDQLDAMYDYCYTHQLADEAEAILTKHNASEDDSDPDEGFYATMSVADLTAALNELEALKNKDYGEAEFTLELNRKELDFILTGVENLSPSTSNEVYLKKELASKIKAAM